MRLIDKDAAVKIAERYGLGSGSVLGRHSGIADAIASEIDSMEQIGPVHAAGACYCRECVYFVPEQVHKNDGTVRDCAPGELFVPLSEGTVLGAHCGRFDSVTAHGYRYGKPSVDETLAWTRADDFCSRGGKQEMTAYEYISRHMTETELLAGLAEECAELAKAALKKRGVLDKSNPTPVTWGQAEHDIIEEIADVEFLLEILGYKGSVVQEEIAAIREEKTSRWAKRLGWKGEDKT